MAVTFRKIMVPHQHEKVFSGQSVTIMAEVMEAGFIDRLITPTSPPRVSVYDPLGVMRVNDGEMIYFSNGHYRLNYLTPAIAGVYTGSFSAENVGEVARIDRVALFKVIKLSDFADISYLVIADQTGQLWYLWIDVAKQLVMSPTIPTFLTKDAISLLVSPIYWLQMFNADSDLVYLLPDTAGQLFAQATQPAIGSGVIGSQTWIGFDGRNYVLELDMLNQITAIEV